MGETRPTGPEQRDAILAQRRTVKMAASAHAFVRGSTLRFYEWLSDLPRGTLPEGPPIWICGDCHLGNLGPLAGADGRVDVQIRDLDQSVVGNPAHDLIRLGLSLAMAARGSDLPGVVTARMLEEMIRGYAAALDPHGRAETGGDSEPPEPEDVRTVRKRAFGRRWRHLARERIETVKPTIPLGRRFWALVPEERAALRALVADARVRDLVFTFDGRTDAAEVRLLDAAYWMKGCSSLGFLRYAVLVAIRASRRKRRLALLDLKEAVAAIAPAAPDAAMPADHAERVVAGARALSPNLGERMLATRLLDRPTVLRELLPQDLKLDVAQFSRSEAVRAARYLAHVVGTAHARQLDEATRARWLREVGRSAEAGLDAPSWLWGSVVDLAGRHEVGYLEHCRRHALAEAA